MSTDEAKPKVIKQLLPTGPPARTLIQKFGKYLRALVRHPLFGFAFVVSFSLVLGVALLLVAWSKNGQEFWGNALVEFGAALLAVGATTLGVDQVMKTRDRYQAWHEWKQFRGFALEETLRSIQKLAFVCLLLLPQ